MDRIIELRIGSRSILKTYVEWCRHYVYPTCALIEHGEKVWELQTAIETL